MNIYIYILIAILIIFIIIFSVKKESINQPIQPPLITSNFSPWNILIENPYYVTLTRQCLTSGCKQSDIIKDVTWQGITECDNCKGFKYIIDPNDSSKKITSKNLYDCCNLWNYDKEDDTGITFKKKCDTSNCQTSYTYKRFPWEEETLCETSLCYENPKDIKYSKKYITDPNNINNKIYSNKNLVCNEPCAKPKYSRWLKYDENLEGMTFYRDCLNYPQCSIAEQDTIQFIRWDLSEECSTNCGPGLTKFKVQDPNNTSQYITSDNMYKCKNNKLCSEYLTPWSYSSENNNGIMFTRTCQNNTMCSDISNTLFLSWEGQDCNVYCLTEPIKKQKYVTNPNDNTRFLSKNTYDCSLNNCPSPEYTNWNILSENEDNAILTRKCKNTYCPNDRSEYVKTVSWTGTTSCSKLCNGGQYKKTFTDISINLTSNNNYSCNTQSCNTLVNFSPWNPIEETDTFVKFSRTCLGDPLICSNINPIDLTLTKLWESTTECPEICNTGTLFKNRKIMANPNNNKETLISKQEYTCNDKPCTPIFSPWKKLNETQDKAIFYRNCENPPLCDPPYTTNPTYMTTTDWTDTICNKPCDGGQGKKIGRDPYNNIIYSNSEYKCNMIPCIKNVTFSDWRVGQDKGNTVVLKRDCSDNDNKSCDYIDQVYRYTPLESSESTDIQTLTSQEYKWQIPFCKYICNNDKIPPIEVSKFIYNPEDLNKKFYKNEKYICNSNTCPKSEYNDWIITDYIDSYMVWNRECKNPPYCLYPYDDEGKMTHAGGYIGKGNCNLSNESNNLFGSYHKLYNYPNNTSGNSPIEFPCGVIPDDPNDRPYSVTPIDKQICINNCQENPSRICSLSNVNCSSADDCTRKVCGRLDASQLSAKYSISNPKCIDDNEYCNFRNPCIYSLVNTSINDQLDWWECYKPCIDSGRNDCSQLCYNKEARANKFSVLKQFGDNEKKQCNDICYSINRNKIPDSNLSEVCNEICKQRNCYNKCVNPPFILANNIQTQNGNEISKLPNIMIDISKNIIFYLIDLSNNLIYYNAIGDSTDVKYTKILTNNMEIFNIATYYKKQTNNLDHDIYNIFDSNNNNIFILLDKNKSLNNSNETLFIDPDLATICTNSCIPSIKYINDLYNKQNAQYNESRENAKNCYRGYTTCLKEFNIVKEDKPIMVNKAFKTSDNFSYSLEKPGTLRCTT